MGRLTISDLLKMAAVVITALLVLAYADQRNNRRYELFHYNSDIGIARLVGKVPKGTAHIGNL